MILMKHWKGWLEGLLEGLAGGTRSSDGTNADCLPLTAEDSLTTPLPSGPGCRAGRGVVMGYGLC